MKKGVITCVLLILALTQAHVTAQEKFNTVRLNIEGKTYQKMNMGIFPINGNGVRIEGKTENGKDWIFSYPDSLYKDLQFVRFEIPTGIDTLAHTTNFRIATDTDTITIGELVIKKNATLNIRYETTTARQGVPYWKAKGVISYKDMIADRYLISSKDDAEIDIFANYSMKELSNEEFANAVETHPDSHHLMTDLVLKKVNRTAPEADVEFVYNKFSEEMKNSFLGKKVYEYLYLIDYKTFENFRLPTWNSDQLEPIAVDTTKYNMLIFSASWCAPCHKLIPALKEIYNDLNETLEMVYISIDEKETMDKWRQLMVNEQIPWRSLLALNDINTIGKKFKVISVPHAILLHPDGTMEKIDIRNDEEKERLYRLVK